MACWCRWSTLEVSLRSAREFVSVAAVVRKMTGRGERLRLILAGGAHRNGADGKDRDAP